MTSTQCIKERPLPRLEHRTGLDWEQLLYLEREVDLRIGPWQPTTGRKKALDLFDAMIATLAYLRCNDIEAVIGEWSRISQSTVSRYLAFLEPVVATCLDELLEAERTKATESDLIVDGFLIPTADLTEPAGLFSGKRNAPGANALLVTDLRGRPVDAGRVQVGSVHDARALADSGLAKTYEQHLTSNGPSMIGDCGFIGVAPLTPFRKPAYRELTVAELWFNRQVNRRRYVVERGIAHLRSWKVLKTGYRRPLHLIDRTLQCVIRLQMYRHHSKETFE